MYHLDMTQETQSLQALADYLRKRKDELGFSFRELSQKAGVSHGALGNALSGSVRPRAETLKKLAAALQVDETHLLRLAGHIETTPSEQRDPVVEKLADTLDTLPPGIRTETAQALNAVLGATLELERRRTRILMAYWVVRAYLSQVDPAAAELSQKLLDAVLLGKAKSTSALVVELIARGAGRNREVVDDFLKSVAESAEGYMVNEDLVQTGFFYAWTYLDAEGIYPPPADAREEHAPTQDVYQAAGESLIDEWRDDNMDFLERELRALKANVPETFDRLMVDLGVRVDAAQGP